jgi:hypothetical protein
MLMGDLQTRRKRLNHGFNPAAPKRAARQLSGKFEIRRRFKRSGNRVG